MAGYLWRLAVVAAALLSIAASPAFDPKPWFADLQQTREALATKYSDLEWAVFDRELDLNALFADARARIEAAQSNADARAAFERLVRRIGDGHVEIRWPNPAVSDHADDGDRCKALGYDPAMFGAPLAVLSPGYRAIASPPEFPAGLLEVNGRAIGVLKIGLFFSKGTPALCAEALRALAIDSKKPCSEACGERIEDWADDRMTRDLVSVLRTLESAGASALLVDIAGNGGGTEWAEAVARMMTPVRLKSEPMGFVRGKHWADEFGELATDLRAAAHNAVKQDRPFLINLATQADAKRKVALTPCNSGPLWQGKHLTCTWLGDGFYGSGLLASADPAQLKGKNWAQLVFSPAKYPYEEGLWKRPLIVLIDGGTGSAASEFAAVLQDNRAAVVLGAPAYGGCGHTNGGTPTTLANSKAVLSLPDCVRFRRGGSNEADGIEPDIVVGFTPGDGPQRKAARVYAKLTEALQRATALASIR